jgi:hypothetical protein
MASGAGRPDKDKELISMFSRLKIADGYSYSLTIHSEIIGLPNEQESIRYINYLSKENFIQYSSTEASVYFLNKEGRFKVDHKSKTVYYKQFDNDSIWIKEQKQWNSPNIGQVLDSLFLKNAIASEKKIVKSVLTIKLKYPAQSMIKSMELNYNTKDSFFSRISYSIDRPYQAKGYNPNIKDQSIVRQVVVMDQYERSIPKAAQAIMTHSKNIYSYLQQTYAGYTLKSL